MALQSWTTPGTFSWTIPAGVTSVKVYGVAGGGGGGAARAAVASGRGEPGGFGAASGGGGAGGQAGSAINVPVATGNVATIVVGAGGTAGTNLSETGGTGGATTFTYASTVYLALAGGYGGFPDCNQANSISNSNVSQPSGTYNLQTYKGRGGDNANYQGGTQTFPLAIDEAYGGGGAGSAGSGGVGNTAPGTRGNPTEYTDSNGLGTIYLGRGGLGGQSVLTGGTAGTDGLGQGGGGGSSQRYMGEELTLQGGAGGCGGVYITYTQTFSDNHGHQIGVTGDPAGQQRLLALSGGSQIVTNHDGATYGQLYFADGAGNYKFLTRKSNSSGNGIALAYHADFISNIYYGAVSNCILVPYPASGSPVTTQLGTDISVDCYGSGTVFARQYELVDNGSSISHRFVRYYFNCVCDCVCACDCF